MPSMITLMHLAISTLSNSAPPPPPPPPPLLQDVLPLSSVDVQVLASQVLGEAVQEKLIPVHIFTASCLPTVLKQLESRDQGRCPDYRGGLISGVVTCAVATF